MGVLFDWPQLRCCCSCLPTHKSFQEFWWIQATPNYPAHRNPVPLDPTTRWLDGFSYQWQIFRTSSKRSFVWEKIKMEPLLPPRIKIALSEIDFVSTASDLSKTGDSHSLFPNKLWSKTFRAQFNQDSNQALPLLNIDINTTWLRNWLRSCSLYTVLSDYLASLSNQPNHCQLE